MKRREFLQSASASAAVLVAGQGVQPMNGGRAGSNTGDDADGARGASRGRAGPGGTIDAFLQKVAQGRKVTIVALGDSITEHTWHTRGHLNWCGYLQEGLFETYGRNRCWVINSGRCGDTAVEALNRLQEDVFRFAPDLVIVSFGMNDQGTPLEEFRAALCTIIERVRARCGAELVLRTPNPIVNPPTALILKDGQRISMETSGTSGEVFARTIVAVAGEKGCAVVDHYSTWKRLEALHGKAGEEPNHLWLYMSDPIHPGPLGHLAFFRELAPLFRVPPAFPWEPAGSSGSG